MTSKKKLERRKRYYLEKEYASALKRGPVTDPDVASRQLKFCIKIIKEMLDDEACLSFSKPVTELWDIDELPGYFTKVRIYLSTALELRWALSGAVQGRWVEWRDKLVCDF